MCLDLFVFVKHTSPVVTVKSNYGIDITSYHLLLLFDSVSM